MLIWQLLSSYGFLEVSVCFCSYMNMYLTRKKTTPWFLDWVASNSAISLVWWGSRGLFNLLTSVWYFFFFFWERAMICTGFSKGVWCERFRNCCFDRDCVSFSGQPQRPSRDRKRASLTVHCLRWAKCQQGTLTGLVFKKTKKPTCR